MIRLTFGLVVVLLCGSLVAQSPQSVSDAAIRREQARERALAAGITSPSRPGPARRVDAIQLRHDADELARLEQTIQAEIAEAQRGVVPKDLSANLKKIQKLSKRLRGELFL